MIGLATSCNGGGALANYVLDENKGYELDRNLLCSSSPKEMVEEMKMIQDLNQRATNKTFSLVLSPHSEDGKILSDEQLKTITRSYLNKLGIDTEKQQYVAFVHDVEKKAKHIHIIANRVQPNGKLISDKHIGKRAQWIAHHLAKEHQLISAKERMFENVKNIDKIKDDFKISIFNKHKEVMTTHPKTFQNYIAQMKEKGIEIIPTINRQGQLQGFRVKDLKTEKEFKSSEVNRSMSASNLIKNGLKNDLNYGLDTTLKRIGKKQTPKMPLSKNTAIQIKHGLKTELKQAKNIGEFQVKSTGKSLLKTFVKTPKMTKEEYKEELKFEKHLDEVVNPHLIITMNESWADSQKTNELSKIQDEKIQIEQDKNDEPKINNLKLEQDYGI